MNTHLYASYFAKYFIKIITFNPFNNLVRQVLLLPPFCR